MASNPKIEFFKGSSWEECIAFIQAIRAAAWAEGKLRDPAWMADFSSLYFSHKSLSWHSKLPIEVRQDWFKLEAALVDRWAPDDEDDSSYIQPVPAAAPKLAGGGGNNSLLYGVLKVVPDDDSVIPQYIKFDGNQNQLCRLTKDREAALQVSFNSRSKSGLLEWTGGSKSSWLAVHWPYSEVPDRSGVGSASWAYLTIVSARDLKSSWAYSGPWQLMESSVSPKGEVTPSWKGMDSSEIALCVFWVGETIYLVPDSETYSRSNPGPKRGKLVLDPMN